MHWARHMWQKKAAFSEFVVLAVNWATTVTNNDFVKFCFFRNFSVLISKSD